MTFIGTTQQKETPTSDSTAAKRPCVIGVNGASEQHGLARRALTQALAGAGNAGAATDCLDLSELSIPLYNPECPEPRDALILRRYVARADAVLLATSVRHDSYSAQLKNALEYCGTDEFDGTPVGLLGVTDGSGAATALEHLRTVCSMLDARVLLTHTCLSIEAGDTRSCPDGVTECRTLGIDIIYLIYTGDSENG